MFSITPSRSFILATAFLAFSGASAVAQTAGVIQRNALPPSSKAVRSLQEKAMVESFILPAMNNDKLLAQAKTLDQGGPFHYAEPVKLGLSCETFGTWEEFSADADLWRAVVDSPGALSLNVGFSEYFLPEGAGLTLYTNNGQELVGPFTSAQNEAHGEFWSPILSGESLTIELIVPKAERQNVRLTIGQVNHGFRAVGEYLASKQQDLAAKSGSCNVDVVCAEGDDWRDQISSVGGYSFGGSVFCTGALVNNTAQDLRPFFLTANHCEITAVNAPSVVVYWNYQNTTCRTPGGSASGSIGNGSLTQFNTGSIFRSASATSDFTLLELDDAVPEAFDIYFSGWDKRNQTTTSSVAIHHPNGDEKRISFDNQPTQITQYLSDTVTPTGSYLKITDWDLGTTEPGSSGSPLYSPEKRIVGQLHGGFAACGNDLSDWYGRIASSWEGGGTNSSSLRPWLDPLNLGVDVLDGRSTNDVVLTTTNAYDDSEAGDGDGFPEPGEQLIDFNPTITNQSDLALTNVSVQLSSTSNLVTINQATSGSFSIPANGSVTLATPLRFSLSPTILCSDSVPLSVVINYQTNGQAQQKNLSILLDFPDVCNVVPEFKFAGFTLDDSLGNGNSNGFMDPSESPIELSFSVQNIGGNMQAIGAVRLLSSSDQVVILGGNSVLPVALQNETKSLSLPLSVGLLPSTVNGDFLPFTLEITYQGSTINLPFTIKVGDSSEVTESYEATPGGNYGDTGLPTILSKVINVPDAGFVKTVQMEVNITHTYVGDNILTLTSPSQTEVVLFNRNGGSSNNFVSTVFVDSATTNIANGFAPYTGSYRPIEPLTDFANEQTQGDWVFTAIDEIDADPGTINSVELTLTRNVPVVTPTREINLAVPDPDTQENLLVTGDTLDLGQRTAGDASSPFQVQIRNSGLGDLYVYSATLPEGLIMIDQELPLIVSQGSEEALLLSPAPDGTSGDFSGNLVLQTNDPDYLQATIPVVFSFGEPLNKPTLWIVE